MSENPISKHQISIDFLEGSLITGLHMGHLFEQASGYDIWIESSGEWLESISSKIDRPERFQLSQPTYAESAYGKTDRSPRNTFAKRHASHLLPLQIRLTGHNKHIEKNFTLWADYISISPQGSIAVRITFQLNPDVLISSKQCIDNYNHFLKKTPHVAATALSSFADAWNFCKLGIPMKEITSELIENAGHSYEIIDFDFMIQSGDKNERISSIKSLYAEPNSIIVRELAAISRMSVAGITALKDARLVDFIESDIGARSDELWVINRERMIRRHPERESIYNQAFFNDIKTAMEILVCQQATNDFLEAWISKRRKNLLDIMLNVSVASPAHAENLKREFQETTQIAQLLIEPLMLQRNVKHSFYVHVITIAMECLGLNEGCLRASSALEDFSRLISSVASFNMGFLSASLSDIQVEIAKSSRRIGLFTVWLTIVGVILTSIQIYIAVKPQREMQSVPQRAVGSKAQRKLQPNPQHSAHWHPKQ